MPNPYHDENGRFCSANEMLNAMNRAATVQNYHLYDSLRSDYEKASKGKSPIIAGPYSADSFVVGDVLDLNYNDGSDRIRVIRLNEDMFDFIFLEFKDEGSKRYDDLGVVSLVKRGTGRTRMY